MARVLQRFLGPASHMTSGQWSAETASGRVALSCPSCSTIQEIPSDREPPSGSDLVRLRWLCEDEGCSFAEFVQLGEWLT